MSETKYNYGFLFKKSQLPNIYLNALLHTDEFITEIDAITAKGNGIEDVDIYEIVKKLYLPKYKSGERSANARMLYKATRSFSKVLCNDADAWRKDFEKEL